MQAPAALPGRWHRPSCERHLGCSAENFLSAQLWWNTFLKSREVCACFIKSAKAPHLHRRGETLTGFQSAGWDSVIRHFLGSFHQANSAVWIFSYVFFCSASRAGVSGTTSCCWPMLLRESSSSQTLPNSPSRSTRCMTVRTSRRRDK